MLRAYRVQWACAYFAFCGLFSPRSGRYFIINAVFTCHINAEPESGRFFQLFPVFFSQHPESPCAVQNLLGQ